MVTGGTRGIGAAVARALAVPGNALVLGYRANEAAAQTLLAELDDPGHPVLAQRCEVADPMQVTALFDTATGRGTLTGPVNAAGILETQHSFTQIDAERWQRVLSPPRSNIAYHTVHTDHCGFLEAQVTWERVMRDVLSGS